MFSNNFIWQIVRIFFWSIVATHKVFFLDPLSQYRLILPFNCHFSSCELTAFPSLTRPREAPSKGISVSVLRFID